MMQMYSTRERCQTLKSEVQSGTFSTKAMHPGFPEVKDAKYLDVSARLHPDGRTVDIFVVNRNLKDAISTTVKVVGSDVDSVVNVETLTHDDLNAVNTFDDPDHVTIQSTKATLAGDSLTYSFPAHSLVKMVLRNK